MRRSLAVLMTAMTLFAASANGAQAVATNQLPSDLQRLLAAAKRLKPRQLSVQLHFVVQQGGVRRFSDRLVIADSPAREEVKLFGKG